MGWLSLKMDCRIDDADGISDMGLGAGALSVALDFPEGRPMVDDVSGSAVRQPDQCTLSFLLPEEADGRAFLQRIADLLQWHTLPAYNLTHVVDRDWVRESRRQLEPTKVGSRLWVVPTWHRAPDLEGVVLFLDPGLAFGTGSHPTTRLCLQWLEENIHGGETVLDYGCGSGILAIGALKLGAGAAIGIDNDPQALETSRANARLNNVDLPCFLPETAPYVDADLLLANILANPLRDLAPTLAASSAFGGRIVLSGILAGQEKGVEETYDPWFRFAAPLFDGQWVCLAGERRS
ncbi:MAG: 50S ribosomal protein L11 methyltransferase [bacterium]|nr:50S ribosomal protein L11 methyltransferase [bacterium]